ncbi:MAG TPA: hypothetical protein DEO70_14375 [Bacteroidales bacterium]|nr:MAG: hypothetical protein A2X11_13305 [Bacteroidetes bacterium GWE2_42_24]OFY26752.1 MAG: hypothetical protein A2X09_10125 [Bacteroidetes bacterium GWF2_43_11]HBZ68017.1 hypothetical protein [Bacteroidales bacterium]
MSKDQTMNMVFVGDTNKQPDSTKHVRRVTCNLSTAFIKRQMPPRNQYFLRILHVVKGFIRAVTASDVRSRRITLYWNPTVSGF